MAVNRGTALPYPPPPGLDKSDDDTPTDTGVTITAAQLAEAIGASTTVAERLLPVATRKVLGYAPQAPVELLNEAVIRFSGYLYEAGFGATRSKTVGPLSIEHIVNHAAMFRNSGAAMLLTDHKIRRGGVIG